MSITSGKGKVIGISGGIIGITIKALVELLVEAWGVIDGKVMSVLTRVYDGKCDMLTRWFRKDELGKREWDMGIGLKDDSKGSKGGTKLGKRMTKELGWGVQAKGKNMFNEGNMYTDINSINAFV